MNNELPKWPLRFLQIICPGHLYEEIEGDLFQKFEKDFRTSWSKKGEEEVCVEYNPLFKTGYCFSK